MGDEHQRQHDLTRALEKATGFRQDADSHWRAAIAEAHAGGVPRNAILKAAGASDANEVREYLQALERGEG